MMAPLCVLVEPPADDCRGARFGVGITMRGCRLGAGLEERTVDVGGAT